MAAPFNAQSPTGPAFDIVGTALNEDESYQALRMGILDRSGYCALIDDGELGWEEHGLTEDQLNFSARHPVDEEAFVDGALRELREAGVIDAVDYPRDQLSRLRESMRESFRHDGRITYIYPEEERLLFALSWIARPSVTVALGAFYGYATAWLLPGVAAAKGRIRLVDIDEAALALADRNLAALGYRDIVEVELCDATRWTAAESIDFCFLDAEGPLEGVPPEQCDKAVYGPILEQVSPVIRSGGLLVAHNVLDDALPRTRYLAARFASYAEQQRSFAAEIERSFDRACVLASTEGVGVYRRRARNGF